MIRFCAGLLVFLLALPARAAEPPRHDAAITVSDGGRRLAIVDRISVTGRERLPLSVAPWMKITGVDLAGTPIAVRGGAVTLPDAGAHQLRVTLEGRVPDLAAAGYGTGDGGLYLPGGAGWLPDTGTDTMIFRLVIDTPAPLRAIATGWLEDDVETSTGRRTTVSAVRPMEPPSLFAGPYRVAERRLPAVRLRTYFHAEATPMAPDYLDRAAAYIARYARQIGPYPYGDFHIVSAPLPVGLGFPSLTYVGRRVLALPFMRGRSLAHEVLHSWWGNAVGVDYASGNWAEGLTTYMADHALADGPVADDPVAGDPVAGDGGREMRLGWLRDFAALPADRDAPVRRFVAKRHRAGQVIGYGKVAMIFHMARAEIGERAFTEALRRFYGQHAYGRAGWSDIARAFAAAAGRDLGWFFDQWLDRAGAPRVELLSAKVSGDGRSVRIGLKQSTPPYRLNLPVRIDTEAGPVRAALAMTEAKQSFDVAVPGRPLRLSVDPGFDVFRRLIKGESPPILRDVSLASAPVLAVLGGDEGFREIARRLAERLTDAPPRLLAAGTWPDATAAALVIGLDADMAGAVNELGLRAPPTEPGTARAWASRRPSGAPVFAVSVRDRAALEALFRGLPHYGRRGYVVFEGGRAAAKGVWPAGTSPLERGL